jgi:hypothetical protein
MPYLSRRRGYCRRIRRTPAKVVAPSKLYSQVRTAIREAKILGTSQSDGLNAAHRRRK